MHTRNTLHPSNRSTTTKSVVILGDSMTYNIQGRKLSKAANVESKSFSGSTVDMLDFVKPFIRRKPDEITMHVGLTTSHRRLQQKLSSFEMIFSLSLPQQELQLFLASFAGKMMKDLTKRYPRLTKHLNGSVTLMNGSLYQMKTLTLIVFIEEVYI